MKGKMVFVVFVLPCIFVNNLLAQNYFIKTWLSSSVVQSYIAYHIHETINNDFILACNAPYGYTQGALFKLDSSGNMLFFKNYFPSIDYNSTFDGLAVTNDSSYLVVGDYEIPPRFVYNRMLLKINSSGNILWCKTLGSGNLFDEDEIIRTVDNNFIYEFGPASSSYNNFKLAKIDQNANVIYVKKIDDSLHASIYISKINTTNDNGLVISVNRIGNALLMRFDSLSNPVFSFRYSDYDKVINAKQTQDGGIICLLDDSANYDSTFTVIKTDSIGNTIWARTFSDTARYFWPKTVFENADQSLYVIANWMLTSSGPNLKAVIIKLDYNGNLLDVKDNFVIQTYVDLFKNIY